MNATQARAPGDGPSLDARTLDREGFERRFTHRTVLARTDDGAPMVIRALDCESVRDMDPRLLVRVDASAPSEVRRRVAEMTRVSHPHVGCVLDSVCCEGVWWVVTHEAWPDDGRPRFGDEEAVPGASVLLADAFAAGLPPEEVARLVAQIADGLEALAARGVTEVGLDARLVGVRTVAGRREARLLAVGSPASVSDVRRLGEWLRSASGRRPPRDVRELIRACVGPPEQRIALAELARRSSVAAAAWPAKRRPRLRRLVVGGALAVAASALAVALPPGPPPAPPPVKAVDVDAPTASDRAGPAAADAPAVDAIARGHLAAAAGRLDAADRSSKPDESQRLAREALVLLGRALGGRAPTDEARRLMDRIEARAWHGQEVHRLRRQAEAALAAGDPAAWAVASRALYALDPTDVGARFTVGLDGAEVSFLAPVEPVADREESE